MLVFHICIMFPLMATKTMQQMNATNDTMKMDKIERKLELVRCM